MSRKKLGLFCAVLGAILLLGAAALWLSNRVASDRAGQTARTVAEELHQQMLVKPETNDAPDSSAQPQDDSSESVLTVDGTDYIGVLSIPTLGLELGVQRDWSYAKLRRTPCRQCGSAETGDLVIAAHNYPSHFGRLGELTPGDGVTFTAADGTEYRYTVAVVEQLEGTDVEKVTQSDHALVLYTCTYGGKHRIVVMCD